MALEKKTFAFSGANIDVAKIAAWRQQSIIKTSKISGGMSGSGWEDRLKRRHRGMRGQAKYRCVCCRAAAASGIKQAGAGARGSGSAGGVIKVA